MNKPLCILLAACCTIATAQAADLSQFDKTRANHVLYPKNSRPFDKSIYAWSDMSVAWVYRQPFDSNPFFDQTGANCGVDQHGPVWFLAPIAAPPNSSSVRYCSIPHDRAILLMAGFFSDTWPCPDPAFKPASGQTLYDFLVADSKLYAIATGLDVTLDGKRIKDGLAYHYISENLASLKGDPSLVSTFDGCITTDYQPYIVNGYAMMFRPLKRGQHTIVRRITGPMGDSTSTYYLDIQ